MLAFMLTCACHAHAQFFGDTRSRQNEEYESYLRCIQRYVQSSPVTEALPSDIASAAISSCDAQYQQLLMPTYQLYGYTQQANDVLNETKQKARDYAVQLVIEARRKR
jgi:hypothetical protein